MHGDLTDSSAIDVLRELSGEGRTGTLAITGEDGAASVSLVEGKVVAASSPRPGARLGDRLVGAGYLDAEQLQTALDAQRGASARLGAILVEQGRVAGHVVRLFVQEQTLDALLEVVRWRGGPFEFRPGAPDDVPEVPFGMAVDDVVVEVARRHREWDEVSKAIPDLDAVPSFRSGSQNTTTALEPDEFAVLASIDGVRSVREIADDLGYGEIETARILYGLTLIGIVETPSPSSRPGADEATPATTEPGDTAATRTALPADLRAVLAELRDLPSRTGGTGPPAAATTSGAASEPSPQEPPAQPRVEPSAEQPTPEPTSGQVTEPGRRHPDRDVSEFLRELSRLALGRDAPSEAAPAEQDDADAKPAEDEGHTRGGEARPTARRRSQPEEGKRRRRGLFGRG